MAAGDMTMDSSPSSVVASQVAATAALTDSVPAVQLASAFAAVPLDLPSSAIRILCVLGIGAILVILVLTRSAMPRMIMGRLLRQLRVIARRLIFADPPSLHMLSILRT